MDLTEHIARIRACKTGAEMRAPLADAFRALFADGKNADYLVDNNGNKLTAEDFALYSDFAKIVPIDAAPKWGSDKLVASNGIAAAIGDFRKLEAGYSG